MLIEKTTSSQLLKSINQQKVLRLIFTDGPISRVELAERTGLTQQTITNIVNRLLSEEVILELSPTANPSGRKPIPLVVNAKEMYAIGIEIAVKYIRGSLMDFEQRLIKELTVDVPVYEGEEHPMSYIYQVIDELLRVVPEAGSLKGIGCSIQGLVDNKEGVIIYSPGLRWRQFPLKEKLADRYQLPIYLENDANLLALVENLNGHLADSTDNITLKFDYGIGGAVVLNNQLCSGATHVAGEFGHYKAFSGEDAHLCHCGAKGCLTTLASVSGLRRNGGFGLEAFDEGVRSEDLEALALFEKVKEAIVRAVSNLITFFNPDHVLFTGKLVDQLHDVFIPQLKQEIFKTIPDSCRGVTLITLPETPDESTSAVGLVMDHFFDVPLERLSLQA